MKFLSNYYTKSHEDYLNEEFFGVCIEDSYGGESSESDVEIFMIYKTRINKI